MQTPDDQPTNEDVTAETPAREMNRRDAVSVLAALPFVAAAAWPAAERERIWRLVNSALHSGVEYAPKFFTAAELRTVRILADMIIPRDERSGSATDAGVPEFMDFWMTDRPDSQRWMRPGLAWIDAQSNSRFGKLFAEATQSQREAILNDVAWPARAPAAMADGVQFFNRFRDLTSSGFWSSQIGVKDLEYKGNTFVPHWDGCPPAALKKLGVNYDKFPAAGLRLTPPASE